MQGLLDKQRPLYHSLHHATAPTSPFPHLSLEGNAAQALCSSLGEQNSLLQQCWALGSVALGAVRSADLGAKCSGANCLLQPGPSRQAESCLFSLTQVKLQ